jgi:hypothetical protein
MKIMMIFNISASYSHKFSFHYFGYYFMTETDLRVRYRLNIRELKILRGFLTLAWADFFFIKKGMNLTFDHLGG